MISFLNGTAKSAILSQSLWFIFWLTKTSNRPISLKTRLAKEKKRKKKRKEKLRRQ